MAEPVLFSQLDGVARILLNRPTARNALNLELCNALLAEMDRVDGLVRAGEVRVLLLEGAGSGFCAGADLKQRAAMSSTEASAHSKLIADCADRLASLTCPAIALVQGAALGGGLELALACDLRIVAHDAILGFPEVTLGFFPGAGGPIRLVRLVGVSTATYLLMTARSISGDEAVRLHIAHEAHDPASLVQQGRRVASELARLPPSGVASLRELLMRMDQQETCWGMSQARKLRDRLNENSEVRSSLSRRFQD